MDPRYISGGDYAFTASHKSKLDTTMDWLAARWGCELGVASQCTPAQVTTGAAGKLDKASVYGATLATYVLSRNDPTGTMAKTARTTLTSYLIRTPSKGSFWEVSFEKPRYGRASSIDVETAGYGLLALMAGGDHQGHANHIAAWLVASRSGTGGWSGSQATIVGLDALAVYATESIPPGDTVVTVTGPPVCDADSVSEAGEEADEGADEETTKDTCDGACTGTAVDGKQDGPCNGDPCPCCGAGVDRNFLPGGKAEDDGDGGTAGGLDELEPCSSDAADWKHVFTVNAKNRMLLQCVDYPASKPHENITVASKGGGALVVGIDVEWRSLRPMVDLSPTGGDVSTSTRRTRRDTDKEKDEDGPPLMIVAELRVVGPGNVVGEVCVNTTAALGKGMEPALLNQMGTDLAVQPSYTKIAFNKCCKEFKRTTLEQVHTMHAAGNADKCAAFAAKQADCGSYFGDQGTICWCSPGPRGSADDVCTETTTTTYGGCDNDSIHRFDAATATACAPTCADVLLRPVRCQHPVIRWPRACA